MPRRAQASAVSLLLAGLVALPACEGISGGSDAPPVTVRDSLGITIRTFPDGDFSDTVSGPPALTVGQEGVPEYEFFQLRTVLPLASGGIVVANGGTSELRWYDAEGMHERTVGRRGNGPAEFGFLTTAWLTRGDTVLVHDPRRYRLVRFDPAGEFIDGIAFSEALDRNPPPHDAPCFTPGLAGRLADGTFVTRGWGCMLFEGSSGLRPNRMALMLSDQSRTDTLGAFRAAQVWERGGATDPREMYDLVPFAGAIRTAVDAERVFVSEGVDLEVSVFDGSATLRTILREDTRPRPVTVEDRDALIASGAETSSPLPEDVRLPERFGGYERLVVAHEGDLWALRKPGPTDERHRWVVFSADGESVRRIVLPEMTVTAVREDRAYGYTTDELGIQRAVAYDVGH